MPGMSGSKVQLPKGVRPPFEVYINGVPQTAGEDFKVREGFKMEELRIPQRIMETASPLGKIDEAFMRQAMAKFSQGLQ